MVIKNKNKTGKNKQKIEYSKGKISEDYKKFFVLMAVLCLVLAFVILMLMLQPSATGNAIVNSGNQTVQGSNIITGSNSLDIQKENFVKHLIRLFVESFDDYIKF